MGIDTYSTTPASNTALFPENMNPSAVNDGMRQVQADVRTWYETPEWINYGYTHTYASATSFTIAGVDYTATYSVGRRIRLVAATPGTIYGKIVTSSFSTNTTVTVVWDSGSLSNEAITSVSLAAVKGASTGRSVDQDATTFYGTAIASAGTINLDSATGDYVHVTGTTTITAVTLASGRRRIVVFDDALTLTHNATSLILPGGANITTAAGDVATFEGEGSSNTRCISYVKANGQGVINIPYTAASSSGAASLEFAEDTDNGSNKVTVSAPSSIASDVAVTLPSTSGTIPVKSEIITLGTPVASTSGTAIDFGSLPTGIKRILVSFVGVSTNGTDDLLIQIGSSGGLETSGYLGSGSRVGASSSFVNSTAGFIFKINGAGSILHGGLELNLVNSSSNTWIAKGELGGSEAAYNCVTGGSKSLSGVLDRLRITGNVGPATFDAGEINIAYT